MGDIMSRTIIWFSCGAPSAVAAYYGVKLIPDAVIVNCDTRPSEHSDNYRFSREVEAWIGRPITYIRNAKYNTVDDVFEQERYMSGVKGARCTTELKKIPRHEFAMPDDIHVFGFTIGEWKRAKRLQANNPELQFRWLLIELLLTKEDCLEKLSKAGIAAPKMYELGFDNNNCPGCVKASSPWYWDNVRRHMPDVFKRRCEQSRALGVRLVEIRHHERIFLDELPAGPFPKRSKKHEDMSCGPECGVPTGTKTK